MHAHDLTDPQHLLDEIAQRTEPCPAPDVLAGKRLCPCGSGQPWPCPATEVAWLARGLDPDEQTRIRLAEVSTACAADDHAARCPHCGGAAAVYSPLWRAWFDRYTPTRKAWEQAHPGESWLDSEAWRALAVDQPPEVEPEERTCQTCEGERTGDLVDQGVADSIDAADWSQRHLRAWRASAQTDLDAAGDALEALRHTEHAASTAAEKLRLELDHVELTQRLRPTGPPAPGSRSRAGDAGDAQRGDDVGD